MRSLWFGKDLPSQFANPVIRDHLSFNGQLHFQCRSCDEVIWADVTFAKLLLERGTGFPCPNCQQQDLVNVKFVATESRLCRQCGAQSMAHPAAEFVCAVCQGHQFTVDETLIFPPYPKRVFALYGAEDPFGQSPENDINFLMEYVRALRMSPQFHQNCLHLVAFIQSIFEHLYGSSADAGNLLNVASGLMRTVYKETGNPDAAYLSIAIMIEGRDLAIDPIQRAVYGFNINQNIYSALARGHNDLLSLRFGLDLKEYGIWLSRQTLTQFEEINEDWLAQLRAKQKWLLGDILKAAVPSDGQIDEALQWFAAALQDSALPKETAGYVRESALAAQAKRRNLTKQERIHVERGLSELAAANLDKSAGLQRIQSLADLLRGQLRAERGPQLRDFALRCLGESIIYAAANDPRNVLRHAGSMLSRLAAGFAAERFSAGAPLEGISGVESFRSFAIEHGNVVNSRGHHEHELEVQLMMKMLLESTAEDPVALAKRMLSQYQKSLERNIRDVLEAREGRFVIWYEVWDGAMLMVKMALRDDELVVQHWLRDFLLADVTKATCLPMANAPPSRLRALQLKTALASGWGLFKSSFENEPITHSSVLIGPSIIGNWPADAAEIIQSTYLGSVRPMTFAPTISVASAACKNAKRRSTANVLLVSYGGRDLPGTQREIEDIKAAYGARVSVLDGQTVGKSDVLLALSKPFDVIHFCGHGEFDYLQPMQSKIYFHNGKGSDGVVTAEDILRCGSIGNYPVVVLSACTSALVLPNGSNNFLGLAGALIRTGATSIVGARWPISDQVGAEFSKYFHDRFARGYSVDDAVSDAKNLLRESRLDEWSAFMNVGG